MKLTKSQLKKIIREMYSPNFEFIGSMSDIGDPMVKQLSKYILPFKKRLTFKIMNTDVSVRVYMYFDNYEVVSVKSSINSKGYPDLPSKENMTLFSVSSAFLKLKNPVDALFKEKGFGPIAYEICLELVSMKGPEFYLTSDRHSLQPDAYNVWEYYFKKRPDVVQKQIDNMHLPLNHRITPDPGDDYPSFTSEEYYEDFEETLVWAQGPDEDEDLTMKQYTDYAQTKDPLMKGYRKNTFPFYETIKVLGLIE